jgi:hypothetical protein
MIRRIFGGSRPAGRGDEQVRLLTGCSCACKCAKPAAVDTNVNSANPGGPYAGGSGCKCTCWCQQGQAHAQRHDDTTQDSRAAG